MADASRAHGAAKDAVRRFWEDSACGEKAYAVGPTEAQALAAQARARYALEPYLHPFARFEEGAGRDVLEVGVGLGADHLEWARSGPRSLSGIDLTERAVERTRGRLAAHGLRSDLRVADAESLPFADASFDLVYSWGVLHHTPDTARAVDETWRVLRPGGTLRAMIYHSYSLVGLMLWVRYSLLAGRPARPLADLYACHLESPGTKAYSVREARRLLQRFRHGTVRVQLSHGDLLEGGAGQRHRGPLLSLARRFYPRPVVRRLLPRAGLYLLLEARK